MDSMEPVVNSTEFCDWRVQSQGNCMGVTYVSFLYTTHIISSFLFLFISVGILIHNIWWKGQKNGKEQERSDRERERVKTRKRGGQSDWVASEIKVCLPQHKITPRYKDEDGYHAVQNQNGHRQRKKKKLYKSRAAFIFLRSRHEGMQKIIVACTNGVQ